MKPEQLRVYEETLENEPRSKLDLYHELILRWRRQGKPYRRIAKLLNDKCGFTNWNDDRIRICTAALTAAKASRS